MLLPTSRLPERNGKRNTLILPPRIEYVWRPQDGPQHSLVTCPHEEVFFGGARGGGKTDGVLGKWSIKERRYGHHFNAIMFRRTTTSAEDAIERSKEIYAPLGGKFNSSNLKWRMPNGGRVSFAYLDNVDDANEYQGRNVTDAWVEEAGQYPTSTPIDRLFGVLRSAHGVPIQLTVTANPGGAGQHWIRDRYGLHPFPLGPKIITRALPDGTKHHVAVIPSRVRDNVILMRRDPGYVSRLHLIGSKQLVKAWLEGDWSAIEGAFFDCWSEKRLVCSPFEIEKEWLRIRSGDWGSAKPFSIGWWAVMPEDRPLETGITLPRGAMVRYREWYGCKPDQPNTGLKLHAEEVGKGIKKREEGEKIGLTALDPSAFAEDGGPSLAERMGNEGAHWEPADNKRVAGRGAMGGWDQMRARMIGEAEDRPMMAVFATCKDFIRTVPVLQHDPNKAEDLDSDGEDHCADEGRYAFMSRPWVPAIKEKTKEQRSGYRDAYERDNTDSKVL